MPRLSGTQSAAPNDIRWRGEKAAQRSRLCWLLICVSAASPFAETSDLVRPAPTPLEERNENTLLLPPVQEHSAARLHRGDQASAARGSGGTRSGADSGSSTNSVLLPPHAWRPRPVARRADMGYTAPEANQIIPVAPKSISRRAERKQSEIDAAALPVHEDALNHPGGI